MNIFFLDKDPKICAQYHADKHVIKMILESAQLLCTALNVSAGEQVTQYKSTHINHPCAIWVRENYSNWMYVYHLMYELQKEWQFRWNHSNTHKSIFALRNSDNPLSCSELAGLLLPHEDFTTPALAMPEQYKTDNAVESYRNYYNGEKKHLHKWTKRETPGWIIT